MPGPLGALPHVRGGSHELADAGGGTAIAVWVSVSGPLGGVAGALNKLGYGTKLSALASEAARGR